MAAGVVPFAMTTVYCIMGTWVLLNPTGKTVVLYPGAYSTSDDDEW